MSRRGINRNRVKAGEHPEWRSAVAVTPITPEDRIKTLEAQNEALLSRIKALESGLVMRVRDPTHAEIMGALRQTMGRSINDDPPPAPQPKRKRA